MYDGNIPILSIITFLPLAGALLLMLFSLMMRKPESRAQLETSSTGVALMISVTVLILSLGLLAYFDTTTAAYQFVDRSAWFGELGRENSIAYHMGVDGISILFVVLTAFLTPLCILASRKSIKKNMLDYMIAFLILETLMIGVFCALDIVLFYIFFEAVLIPMFIIIGVWGGKDRVYASYKFFLYTLLGSVLMLVAVLWIYFYGGTSSIPDLHALKDPIPANAQKWLWLAFFASFAVKMPMWPVHTWLPDAHVQAPTAGSVILAGILLKMGGYGFLRFSLPLFPDASVNFAPLVFGLSVVAIIYTSLVAYRQNDIKKLIAYSSVAHMGFVTMGIFAFNSMGIQGAIFQMLSHGLISGALFFGVGVIYDRMHTREISFYGGLAKRMPIFAFFLMLFTMANVGLPGTSGFIGEIWTLIGTFQVNKWVAAGAALGMVLSPVYALYLYREVVFGEQTNEKLDDITDMNKTEIMVMAPLAVFTIILGVYPSLVTDVTSVSVENLITNFQAALGQGS